MLFLFALLFLCKETEAQIAQELFQSSNLRTAAQPCRDHHLVQGSAHEPRGSEECLLAMWTSLRQMLVFELWGICIPYNFSFVARFQYGAGPAGLGLGALGYWKPWFVLSEAQSNGL